MAATKRNSGLTSAVPRASLNDEELVSLEPKKSTRNLKLIIYFNNLSIFSSFFQQRKLF